MAKKLEDKKSPIGLENKYLFELKDQGLNTPGEYITKLKMTIAKLNEALNENIKARMENQDRTNRFLEDLKEQLNNEYANKKIEDFLKEIKG